MLASRTFRFVAIGACVLVGAALSLALRRWPGEHPNLVLIVVDTMRADALSSSIGAAETPNIDRLALEGVLYPQAFSHAPMTLPAHTSLFSSRLPSETGVTTNGLAVPASTPLLAEHLADRGYQTAAVVSLATMWPEERGHGLDRGFEYYSTGRREVERADEVDARLGKVLDRLDPKRPFFLFAHFSDPHEPYNDYGSIRREASLALDGRALERVVISEMCYWDHSLMLLPGRHRLEIRSEHAFKLRRFTCVEGDELLPYVVEEGRLHRPVQRVVVALDNHSDGAMEVRLSAWLNDAPPLAEVRERYEREVEAADRAIGELLDELRMRGLYDDTLIVLTSDHGEALGEHSTIGHVVNLYDELLRVPLIVRPPSKHPEPRLHQARDELVRLVDVAPTILELLDLPGWSGMSGESLLQPANRVLRAETHEPEAPRTLFAVRDDKYKLIYEPELDAFRMFRLGPDPLELYDVFEHQGHLRSGWQSELRRAAIEGRNGRPLDPETVEELRSLGYVEE